VTLQDLTDRTTALVTAARDLERECRARVAALPAPSADLAALLSELVAAYDMTNENFVRWPRFDIPSDDPRHPYQPGTECYEHWSRACRAKDAAVLALLRYGRAVAR
jgi:hypothetical protein